MGMSMSRTPATAVVKMANFDKDRKIIDLVKSRPILWDARVEEYKLTERKEAVWGEVADAINSTVG